MGQDACLGERDTKCLSRATSHNAWAPPPTTPFESPIKEEPPQNTKIIQVILSPTIGLSWAAGRSGRASASGIVSAYRKGCAAAGLWHSMARKRSHLYPENGWKMMKAVKKLWINSLVIEPLMLSYWVIDSLRESHHGMLIFIGVPPLFDGWDLSNELLNGHYTSGSLRNSEKRQRQEKTWEIIIELFYDVYSDLSWQLMMYRIYIYTATNYGVYNILYTATVASPA